MTADRIDDVRADRDHLFAQAMDTARALLAANERVQALEADCKELRERITDLDAESGDRVVDLAELERLREENAELRCRLDESTPTPQAEFEADLEAYEAVRKWVDETPGVMLVGCTPSMIAGVALNAYRKALGAEPASATTPGTGSFIPPDQVESLTFDCRGWVWTDVDGDEYRSRAGDWQTRVVTRGDHPGCEWVPAALWALTCGAPYTRGERDPEGER